MKSRKLRKPIIDFDLFCEDEFESPIPEFESLDRFNNRAGPCDDDCERTAPYIGMLPDESGKEDGSPINPRGWGDQVPYKSPVYDW